MDHLEDARLLISDEMLTGCTDFISKNSLIQESIAKSLIDIAESLRKLADSANGIDGQFVRFEEHVETIRDVLVAAEAN